MIFIYNEPYFSLIFLIFTEIYGYTADKLSKLSLQGFFANMLPVTLGNIIGGMVFVALPLYLIHSKSIDK